MNNPASKLILPVLLSITLCSAVVIELSPTTFDTNAEAAPVLLLEFYAPWCGHCQRFESSYEEVSERLAGGSAVVARVDGSAHRILSERFKVTGFPAFYLVEKGNVLEYTGPRTVDALVNFVNTRGAEDGRKLDTMLGPFHLYWRAIAYVMRKADAAHTWLEKNPLNPVSAGALAIGTLVFVVSLFAVVIYFVTKPVQRLHAE